MCCSGYPGSDLKTRAVVATLAVTLCAVVATLAVTLCVVVATLAVTLKLEL